MDRLLRAEVVATVRKAVEESMLVYEERWLTAEQICEHVGVMTPRWMKDHGQMFERTRMEWTDKQGQHSSSWVYPLHRIQKMIASGEIKQLRG